MSERLDAIKGFALGMHHNLIDRGWYRNFDGTWSNGKGVRMELRDALLYEICDEIEDVEFRRGDAQRAQVAYENSMAGLTMNKKP